ncbi:MAG TPA: hypothetical protein VG944_05625 [Fimbriimonas sp.]|nr:hypothetical protein [Fimbriimonas sp.]
MTSRDTSRRYSTGGYLDNHPTVATLLVSIDLALGGGISSTAVAACAVAMPAEPDPERAKEAKIVASSARITPKFQSFAIQLALELSEESLHANQERIQQENLRAEERRAQSMAEFRHRMEVKDDNTRQFCNYVLDRQDYVRPNGSIVTLPSEYNHSWVNEAGEYILNSDPTFDPKGSGSGGWTELEKYVPKG